MNKQMCPHCGRNMKPYQVPLTLGFIKGLVKFRIVVGEKGQNKVHLLKDMQKKPYELTPHEWNNFTRLRFHGLVAKYREDGKPIRFMYFDKENRIVNSRYAKMEDIESFLIHSLADMLEGEGSRIKESHLKYHDEDGIRYLDPEVGVSLRWEEGYNYAVKKMKAHLAEVVLKIRESK